MSAVHVSTRRKCPDYGEWSGTRMILNYFELPPREAFTLAVQEECPEGSFSWSRDPWACTDEVDEPELWALLEDAVKHALEHDDLESDAGDWASSVLYCLGFEWV